MNLNNSNCSVDKETGAVMVHKSPELQEILRLRQEVSSLNEKMDTILKLLKGGKEDGQKMAKWRQCQINDQ